MPDDLDDITATATKHVEIASMGIAPKRLLHLQRQTVHATPHVGVAHRQPDPDVRGNRDHPRRTAKTRRSVEAPTCSRMCSTVPSGKVISRLPSSCTVAAAVNALPGSAAGIAHPSCDEISGATRTAMNRAARRLAAIRIADPDVDPDMSRGLSFAFLVKALARHAVSAWEGVGDVAGKPLLLSPEAAERLMDLDDIAAAFWDRATAPVAAVAAEETAEGPRRLALRPRARLLPRLRRPGARLRGFMSLCLARLHQPRRPRLLVRPHGLRGGDDAALMLGEGALVGVLEASPTADVVDQDQVEIRPPGSDIVDQALEAGSASEAQAAQRAEHPQCPLRRSSRHVVWFMRRRKSSIPSWQGYSQHQPALPDARHCSELNTNRSNAAH